MIGRRIKQGLQKALKAGGAVTGKTSVNLTSSAWKMMHRVLTMVVDPLHDHPQRFLIQKEEDVERCGLFFGANYYFFHHVLCPEESEPLMMGSIRISMCVPHKRWEKVKKPLSLYYDEKEERLEVRFGVCYRLVSGYVNRGCEVRPNRIEEEEEKERVKKEQEIEKEMRKK